MSSKVEVTFTKKEITAGFTFCEICESIFKREADWVLVIEKNKTKSNRETDEIPTETFLKCKNDKRYDADGAIKFRIIQQSVNGDPYSRIEFGQLTIDRLDWQ